jgi:pimeloyl-ACP methyl ester carboxylesterase
MQNTHWIDRSLYPFESRYLDPGEGRMHYVDEGTGSPILMVHGTPTWSFLYRDLISCLSKQHRVVAPDHLGFGLSDKPEDAAYRPEDHARRLSTLVERLGLENLTMVVHDVGGPIGLSYAVNHPENVSRLVLFNTWMWSLEGNAATERASRVLGGPIGRFLYKRLNFSPKVLLKAAYGDKAKLTPEVHRHYTAVFPTSKDRTAPWMFARELIGSSRWYERLWQQRDQIQNKPTLIVWGLKDPTFKEADLKRWEQLFTQARVVRLPEVGHLVPEEAAETVVPLVEEFLTGHMRAR